MKRTVLFAALLSITTLSFVAMAKFKSIGQAEVAFQAKGPAGLAINGSSSDLKAEEAGGKIKFIAKLSSIKTGIGLRDKHLKKMLTKKSSKAELLIDKSKVEVPKDKKTASGDTKGKLKMNGVVKPVTVKYKVKRTGSDYHVQGMFDINYTDFGWEKQCYMGVCVDEQVKIKVKLKLRDS